jgi:predicted regulator of Ras-like GTPase activity (Roadblock/LC7/MglB family)
MTSNSRGLGGDLNWLLDDLVNRVAQVQKAVMLTQDGLAIGVSRGLTREDAEHLAALSAGFQSLARGAGRQFGGGQVRQTIIEMESAFLFVSAAGQGTCLAVLSAADADVGLIAYEMAVLVRRSNEHLAVAFRTVNGERPAQQPQSMTGPGATPSYPMPGSQSAAGPPMPPMPTRVPAPAAPPRAMPAANPVYSPYPAPAGRPESAPYTE